MSHHHGLAGAASAAALMLGTSMAIPPALAVNWAAAAAPAIVKDPEIPFAGRLLVSFATSRDAQPAYVDLGSKSMGPGDQYVVTDLPMPADNGAQVGTWQGVEAIPDDAPHGSISDVTTLRLRDGRVWSRATPAVTARPQCAVIEGTGARRAARRHLSLLSQDDLKGISRHQLTLVPAPRCLSTP